MNNSSSLSSDISPRRQPKQKRGQARVEKILLAAVEVFTEVGYTAATTQQIADRANTAIGSIYQFFPDKLAIFHALEAEYLQQAQEFSQEFFKQDIYRPLGLGIGDLIDRFARYIERPLIHCIYLQFIQPPVPGLFLLLTDELGASVNQQSIAQHAAFYRQRNPDLSQARSELLSEMAHRIYESLALVAVKSPADRRLVIYEELKAALYGYLNPHIGDHLLQVSNQLMICPDCQSDRVAKNGRQQGKQRYICRGCGRQFLDRYTPRGYPLEIRQRCLDLHAQGISFRKIERQTGVDCNTVINWVKSLEPKSAEINVRSAFQII
jgi:AcrR family transcriptional regulator/transposase-like protein